MLEAFLAPNERPEVRRLLAALTPKVSKDHKVHPLQRDPQEKRMQRMRNLQLRQMRRDVQRMQRMQKLQLRQVAPNNFEYVVQVGAAASGRFGGGGRP